MKKLMAEMNVTPLVDVVLVLLIIFMILSPTFYVPIDINTPEKKTQGQSSLLKEDAIVISVNKKKQLFLKGEIVKIEDFIHKIGKEKNKTLYFNIDKEMNYGDVLAMLEDFKNQGFFNFSFLTEDK